MYYGRRPGPPHVTKDNESSTHTTTVRSPWKSSTGSSSGDTNHGDKKYKEKKQSG